MVALQREGMLKAPVAISPSFTRVQFTGPVRLKTQSSIGALPQKNLKSGIGGDFVLSRPVGCTWHVNFLGYNVTWYLVVNVDDAQDVEFWISFTRQIKRALIQADLVRKAFSSSTRGQRS